jgi:hypothetical protein
MLEKEEKPCCWIVTQNQSEEKLKEYLDELEFLTLAGGQVVKRFFKNGTTKSQNICRNRENRRNPSCKRE